MQTIKSTGTTANPNGNFGVDLWWTVPEMRVDGDFAQRVFEKHGFEVGKDLPLPSRRLEVSRAAYSFQDRRHKDGRKVTEKTTESPDYVAYGILGQARRAEFEVAYDQGTTIKLWKDSGRVEVEGRFKEEFLKELELYEGAITDSDIRTFLRRIVTMCRGVAKRPTGGIYFIPEQFADIVESAQQALNELGTGVRLYVQRVINGEPEREIVWEAVETDIGSQIDATLNAVEKIGKRVSAVRSHEAKVEELQELMKLYQGILGREAHYEELAERLDDAANQIAAKMKELNDLDSGRQPSKPSKRRNGIGVKIQNEVETLLREVGHSLHYTDIAEKLVERGVELNGKDNAGYVNSWISQSIRNEENRFNRLGKGYYDVV